MQISFHIGAHRTATTSFQACLRENLSDLRAAGVDAWGPRVLRKGLFAGLADGAVYPRAAGRAQGRVALGLAKVAARGTSALVISEENALGSVRGCVRARALYPDVANGSPAILLPWTGGSPALC